MSIKKSPVYNVIAVPVEKVQANDYNPNVVAIAKARKALNKTRKR